MLRFSAIAATTLAIVLGFALPAQAAPPYTADKAVKLHVLGEWAHPDDDTSIIGPCGVWHQRYNVRCGIIMVTRGEGGGNAVGTEIGPALGLRRENEDRVAHYRSGTVDIFNLDRVDFFYNTSAPLTQKVWGQEETLRRVTRIIRMTQPEIYIGFPPSLAVGHGNHQQAGRLIWEGVKAAADPTMFPEQLQGPNALSTWQVKKVFHSFGFNAGTGFSTTSANCLTGFQPDAATLNAVAGVWTGYDSPYLWPAGNLQGIPTGTAKSWAQVAQEGARAYPTQSRVMWQGFQQPGCSRFGMGDSFVPFQPNVNPNGSLNPLAGRDEAILYGAVLPDPGGLPKGTIEELTFSEFYNTPGEPFDATVRMRSGSGTLTGGSVTLTVPAGWNVDSATKPIGPVTPNADATVTFTVTPPAGATVNAFAKIAAVYAAGSVTGYTDNVVRIVPPVEGRMQRWGKWAEYESWLENTAPRARKVGRSDALRSIGVGETITVPVEVTNRSSSPQSGTVTLTAPGNFTVSAPESYGPLAPGASTTVEFDVTNTDSSLPATNTANVTITTTYDAPAGSGTETMQLSIVPTTTIPAAGSAPALDAAEGAGEYSGPALDIGRRWEGGQCDPVGVDCGNAGGSTPGDPNSSYAKVTRHGDDLYFFVHVRDDYQSYAVTPSECVAHWLADSVELLIDPRGTASDVNLDTGGTFKLGIFPFSNDPQNTNGNGANGPCWSRDADNHQGYSTGPLAATVKNAPNAPGVQVVSSAQWVGSNQTTTNHAYAGGAYDLEVKIPMAVLPAAVDPDHMGLNITPYDNDNTAAEGTTTLRHIDNSSRLAWSPFGSVQSDPWRWGHAQLTGYTPPADRPTTPGDPILSSSNLGGTESPQTIAQSAHDGVPIAGRTPAPANDQITSIRATLGSTSAQLRITASGPGKARIFLWSGVEGYIPVWTTTCSPQDDPPPDYGLTPCATTDGGVPPWGGDMSGRVVRSQVVDLSAGTRDVTIALDAAAYAKLAADGSALVSFETPAGEVQAFDVPLAQAKLWFSVDTGTGADDPGKPGRQARLVLEVEGTRPFPGTPTGQVQFRLDGTPLGAPVALDDRGRATLVTTLGNLRGHTLTAEYSGDGNYAARTASIATPKGGAAAAIKARCVRPDGHHVRCRVTATGAGAGKGRMKATIRVAGRRKSATARGTGAVTVTLQSKRRIRRSDRIVVEVVKGDARARLKVKPGRPARSRALAVAST